MGKFQRDKGKRGERLIVTLLKPFFPNVGRDLNDVYAKRGIDLVNTGNLAIQVKHYAKHVPLSKYDEIIPGEGQVAMLVSCPTDRESKPLVVISLDDFLRILDDPKSNLYGQ